MSKSRSFRTVIIIRQRSSQASSTNPSLLGVDQCRVPDVIARDLAFLDIFRCRTILELLPGIPSYWDQPTLKIPSRMFGIGPISVGKFSHLLLFKNKQFNVKFRFDFITKTKQTQMEKAAYGTDLSSVGTELDFHLKIHHLRALLGDSRTVL